MSVIEQTPKSSNIHKDKVGHELFGASRAKAVLVYDNKGIVNHAWKRLHLMCSGSKLESLKQKYVLNVKAPASPWGEIQSSHLLQVRLAAPCFLLSPEAPRSMVPYTASNPCLLAQQQLSSQLCSTSTGAQKKPESTPEQPVGDI